MSPWGDVAGPGALGGGGWEGARRRRDVRAAPGRHRRPRRPQRRGQDLDAQGDRGRGTRRRGHGVAAPTRWAISRRTHARAARVWTRPGCRTSCPGAGSTRRCCASRSCACVSRSRPPNATSRGSRTPRSSSVMTVATEPSPTSARSRQGSDSATTGSTSRSPRSRAVSGVASSSRASCSRGATSSCSTNRRTISTSTPSSGSWASCAPTAVRCSSSATTSSCSTRPSRECCTSTRASSSNTRAPTRSTSRRARPTRSGAPSSRRASRRRSPGLSRLADSMRGPDREARQDGEVASTPASRSSCSTRSRDRSGSGACG